MRIPPHWARASHTGVDERGVARTAWATGWSFADSGAAEADARARAKRVWEHLARGERPESYAYLDQPLREEIVEELGEGIGTVTRNRYGALVLNAPRVCFVDVDFPEPRSRGWFDAFLLSCSAKRRRRRAAEEAEVAIRVVEDWGERHADRPFRLYRTAAGLRLLFTDRLYDPSAAETAALFDELSTDPLYRRLTTKQECFRARLSPKPWRCGCPKPPHVFPYVDASQAEACRRWRETYEASCRPYAVCRLLRSSGADPTEEPIRRVIDHHDHRTVDGAETPLA